MSELLILGAGTGGAIVANMLARRLDEDWNITLIDRAEHHYYQPGLLFLPFRLYDYHDERDILRPIADSLPKRAKLVRASVQAIDPTSVRSPRTTVANSPTTGW